MRARAVASAASAAIAALILAGCTFITPIATLEQYDASDGVSGVVGDVHILNALVLSEDGESGNLLFTAVNDSGDKVELTVQYGEGGDKTDVPLELDARSRTDFGFGEGGQLFLTAIDTVPGSLLPLYFQYGDAQGVQLQVPVLDGSLGEYTPYLPVTPTPTPTPELTGTPAPDPTETPAS